jgi:ornithine cyclodeaminase
MTRKLNVVPFVSVDTMMRIVLATGIERFLLELADHVEEDFRRWELFDKAPRLASHSRNGVIELMPTSDGEIYSFKYVNGHPSNTREGRQTVTAFGMLADVATGYPLLLSEMTILTALRTAATSAVAAKHLAPPGARTMAIIGNGAQSEFQAMAFKAVLGIHQLRLYDIDPSASRKCLRNLTGQGFEIEICASAQEAMLGAEIVTTVTADKQYATILTDNMVGPGIHINAVGGDCPGKTELHVDILHRCDIFVEYPPQTRIRGGATRGRSRCSTRWVSRSRTFLRCAMCVVSAGISAFSMSWIYWPIPTSQGIYSGCCCGLSSATDDLCI